MSNLPIDNIPDIPKFGDGIENKDIVEADQNQTDVDPVPKSAVDSGIAPERQDKQDGTGVEAVAAGIVATLEEAAAAGTVDGEEDSAIERTATPGSRTSTPPLGLGASAPKKFARVDVTKKFLSKTGTPAPAAKVTGRTSSSPVPIAQPARLLSTKLTTAPISKTSSSSSPKPPIPVPVASSSPWAKTSIPDRGDKPSLGLQQPMPKKLGNLGGQSGLLKGPQKTAWRSVPDTNAARVGMSRDFPTANEIAEGKKAAQLAAQAQAAHNQALLQSINAFTHLDSKEDRWDEDDDDDEELNFGNGGAPPAPEVPVGKVERFGNDDFDRSWPRQPDGPERVLFNASNNRLESQQSRPAPMPAPTRVMSRPLDRADRDMPPHAARQPDVRGAERSLPPHLAAPGRAPPPHLQMQAPTPPQEERRDIRPNRMDGPPAPSGLGTGRTAWNISAQPQYDTQPQRSDLRRPSDSRQIRPSPGRPDTDLPPVAAQAASTVKSPSAPVTGVAEDEQAAEMHNAAEKARLRRLADEEERIAAQERAKRKAKELEARLAAKSKPAEKAAEQVAVMAPKQEQARAPPGLNGQRDAGTAPALGPHFTIAQRPKVEPTPVPEQRPVETSWRRAPTTPAIQTNPVPAVSAPPPTATTAPVAPTAPQVHAAQSAAVRAPPEMIEPVVRLPGQPITNHVEDVTAGDGKFDDVLARIQATMTASKATASPSAPVVEIPETAPAPAVPVKGYFESTQIEPPRSPPPAWRTYTVRLPTASRSLPPIPLSRVRAAEASALPPKGWCQTFNPPLEGLDKSQVLIPRPLATRIHSVLNGAAPSIPIALPKGTLDKVLVPKKEKRKVLEERAPVEPVPIMAIESLMAAPIPEPSPTWSDATAPARKKSPVKTSMAAKAERQGVFAQEAVSLSTMARRDSLPGGVRFMVSSELEGDSLLDEVNKMSLEAVDEGMGDGAPKTSGSETPKTPPSMAPRSTTQPSSPTGTPWGRRHDHLKSVWDSANDRDKAEAETAMYPSLNTPLSSEPVSANKTYESYESVKPAAYNSDALRTSGWSGNPYTQQQNYAVQGQLWSPAYGPSMSTPGYGFQQAGAEDKAQERRVSGYNDGYYGQVQPAAAVAQLTVPVQAQAQGFGAGFPYTPAQVNAYRQAQAAAAGGQTHVPASSYGYGNSVQQAVMGGAARRGRFAPNGEHGGAAQFAGSRQPSYGAAPNAQIRHNAQQLLHQQQLAARQHALMQHQQQHQQQHGAQHGGGYFGGIGQQVKQDGKRSAE